MTGTRYFLVLACLAAAVAFGKEPSIQVTSPDFHNGERIPARFTCDGQNTNPTLRLSGVPPSARSLVLIMDDPDAPSGTFTHWLLWNIDPGVKEIAGVPKGAIEGRNDFGNSGYGGPCPPSGAHRYLFKVYALDVILNLNPGAGRREVDAAIRGHIAARGLLVGEYGRSESAR